MFGLGTLRRVAQEIGSDVAAARDRDPAARGVGTVEILTSWAGVQALLAHRVSHALYEAGVPLAPRTIAFTSRAVTGIEIHPAARIGEDFFIDHGSGVVIGETAEIGDRVTLYQGVTLGGTGFARGKRHPTVEDDVTIGSGAKLLGPVTRRPRRQGRGEHGRDRGRAARTRPWSATPAIRSGSRASGPRGRTPTGSTCPDPVAEAIKALSDRLGGARGAAGRARRQGRRGRGQAPEHQARARARPAAEPLAARSLDLEPLAALDRDLLAREHLSALASRR